MEGGLTTTFFMFLKELLIRRSIGKIEVNIDQHHYKHYDVQDKHDQ
jgi:hypothetical protein